MDGKDVGLGYKDIIKFDWSKYIDTMIKAVKHINYPTNRELLVSVDEDNIIMWYQKYNNEFNSTPTIFCRPDEDYGYITEIRNSSTTVYNIIINRETLECIYNDEPLSPVNTKSYTSPDITLDIYLSESVSSMYIFDVILQADGSLKPTSIHLAYTNENGVPNSTTNWGEETGYSVFDKYIFAPSQLNLKSADELLPGVTALGKYGSVTGTDAIYSNIDTIDMLRDSLGDYEKGIYIFDKHDISKKSLISHEATTVDDYLPDNLVRTYNKVCTLDRPVSRIYYEKDLFYGISTENNDLVIFDINGTEIYSIPTYPEVSTNGIGCNIKYENGIIGYYISINDETAMYRLLYGEIDITSKSHTSYNAGSIYAYYAYAELYNNKCYVCFNTYSNEYKLYIASEGNLYEQTDSRTHTYPKTITIIEDNMYITHTRSYDSSQSYRFNFTDNQFYVIPELSGKKYDGRFINTDNDVYFYSQNNNELTLYKLRQDTLSFETINVYSQIDDMYLPAGQESVGLGKIIDNQLCFYSDINNLYMFDLTKSEYKRMKYISGGSLYDYNNYLVTNKLNYYGYDMIGENVYVWSNRFDLRLSDQGDDILINMTKLSHYEEYDYVGDFYLIFNPNMNAKSLATSYRILGEEE